MFHLTPTLEIIEVVIYDSPAVKTHHIQWKYGNAMGATIPHASSKAFTTSSAAGKSW